MFCCVFSPWFYLDSTPRLLGLYLDYLDLPGLGSTWTWTYLDYLDLPGLLGPTRTWTWTYLDLDLPGLGPTWTYLDYLDLPGLGSTWTWTYLDYLDLPGLLGPTRTWTWTYLDLDLPGLLGPTWTYLDYLDLQWSMAVKCILVGEFNGLFQFISIHPLWVHF